MRENHNGLLKAVSKGLERFFYSEIYIATVAMIGLAGFIFKYEIYAIFAVALFGALNWVFCRDLMPSFIAMAIIAMTPLARYGEVGYFIPKIFYVAAIIGPAIIIRMFVFPPRLRAGRFFVPTLAVALAVTLGGLFSIKLKDYLAMPSLYYTLALGIGMLVVYMFLESDIPHDKAELAQYFAKMMVGIGIMGIGMIVSSYLKYGDEIGGSFYRFAGRFQWGNNLSNNLLLSMPFAFYLGVRGKGPLSFFYFTIGLLQYVALALSLSRGGIVFGTVIFPFILLCAFLVAKKRRLSLLLAMALTGGLVYICFELWISPLLDSILDIVEVSGGEARVKLYQLAWQNFLEYPIFGTGLGFVGNAFYFPKPMAMYWYHSTIFQILGSLGAVGLAAYGLQALVRAVELLRVRSAFNLFATLSVLGFAGYSMVNVGYFVPFPFVAMTIHLFVVVERYNETLLGNKALFSNEQLVLSPPKSAEVFLSAKAAPKAGISAAEIFIAPPAAFANVPERPNAYETGGAGSAVYSNGMDKGAFLVRTEPRPVQPVRRGARAYWRKTPESD